MFGCWTVGRGLVRGGIQDGPSLGLCSLVLQDAFTWRQASFGRRCGSWQLQVYVAPSIWGGVARRSVVCTGIHYELMCWHHRMTRSRLQSLGSHLSSSCPLWV